MKGFTLSLVMNICARYQLQGQTITTQCQTEWSPALAGQQTTVAVSQLGVSLPPPHNFTAGWHPIFSVHDKYLGEKVTLDIMEGVSSESPRISQTFGQSIKSAFSSHFAEAVEKSRDHTWQSERALSMAFDIPADLDGEGFSVWQWRYEAFYPISGKVTASEWKFMLGHAENSSPSMDIAVPVRVWTWSSIESGVLVVLLVSALIYCVGSMRSRGSGSAREPLLQS